MIFNIILASIVIVIVITSKILFVIVISMCV